MLTKNGGNHNAATAHAQTLRLSIRHNTTSHGAALCDQRS